MKLSVVIPVRDEVDNIDPLCAELGAALAALGDYEVLFVDDGSTDGTAEAVLRAADDRRVRLLRHARPCGQSAALVTGVAAARAEWVGTLDGDGQDDPADLCAFYSRVAAAGDASLRLVIGHRTPRHDSWLRRCESRVANRLRAALLGDATPDAGCGTKLFHRDTFLRLPAFDHMHCFLPALFQRAGARVVSLPVRHRRRRAGRSKYGTHDRLWGRLVDIAGVMWLQRRGLEQAVVPEAEAHVPAKSAGSTARSAV